ncbi:20111_t:CDS:2, partial [Gigaspora margarita]
EGIEEALAQIEQEMKITREEKKAFTEKLFKRLHDNGDMPIPIILKNTLLLTKVKPNHELIAKLIHLLIKKIHKRIWLLSKIVIANININKGIINITIFIRSMANQPEAPPES